MSETVYKITTAEAWAAAVSQGSYRGSADDRRDGFIHLSAADQAMATAVKYFSGQRDLVLIAFVADALGSNLKWEASRGGHLFPHYYGELATGAALWVRPLPLDETGVPRVADVMKS
jgi:uncharacterized protein (DUF952 family)